MQEADLPFDMDKTFDGGASGDDIDSMKRRYTAALVQTIANQDKPCEVEALRGLGDKAKVSKDKEEYFNKACALYSEVLQQCVDRNERLIMEHRIKYAEKCTKLVYYPKEALKSLGDLYVERGRLSKDEVDFVKAKGLYGAALKICEDSARTDQSILTDRIQNVDKVMQEQRKQQQQQRSSVGTRSKENVSLVPFLATGEEVSQHSISHNNGKSLNVALSASGSTETHNLKDTDRLYKGHLQEGDEALERGDLDEAEEHFATALKAVHVRDSTAVQYQKEAEPLSKLAHVHLQRGQRTKDGGNFTKAAALCNAASVRADLEDNLS
ncbi:Hypp3742 [Branchiostoma lanceolatum]|uniref:Hypp3742 protein n=1 Tax=Branchiostoma lanceolatum TaxID=7740 RepID=A0A8K0EYP4_BRALA|nr:Hypp3742 [Branchiostoma lanceolatum]